MDSKSRLVFGLLRRSGSLDPAAHCCTGGLCFLAAILLAGVARAQGLTNIHDVGSATNLVEYHYVGASRVESRDYPINGTHMAVTYDGLRRVTGTNHTKAGTRIDERTYTWDAVSNKTSRTEVLANSSRVQQFAYDSANRLGQSIRTNNGVPTPSVNYALDGVGNRSTVTGGSQPGSYVMAPTTDFKVNQYTSTPSDTRSYDKNGNLSIVAGSHSATIVYDYRNQMVSYTNGVGTQTTYAYDALGRRIRKVVGANTFLPKTTNFYYCGWNVIEEQNAQSVTKATYVYGLGLDDVLSMRRGGLDYYYHADDMGNVMKITSTQGTVVESYEYNDYGELLDGSTLQPIASSPIGNPYLFTGARFDPETGFYHLRTRYLEPITGRFTTRDSIGIWGDGASLGNGMTYAGNNPWTFEDPTGTSCKGRVPHYWKCGYRQTYKKWSKEWRAQHRAEKMGDRDHPGILGNVAHSGTVSKQSPSEETLGNTYKHGSATGGTSFFMTQGNTAWHGSGGSDGQTYRGGGVDPAHPWDSTMTGRSDKSGCVLMGCQDPAVSDSKSWLEELKDSASRLLDKFSTQEKALDTLSRIAEAIVKGEDVEEALERPHVYMIGPGWAETSVDPTEVANAAVSLFRACSDFEYDDLMETGEFRPAPDGNSFETGKWFAESGEDASEWGERFKGISGEDYKVIEARYQRVVADSFLRTDGLDGIGPARFGEYPAINTPRPTITSWP